MGWSGGPQCPGAGEGCIYIYIKLHRLYIYKYFYVIVYIFRHLFQEFILLKVLLHAFFSLWNKFPREIVAAPSLDGDPSQGQVGRGSEQPALVENILSFKVLSNPNALLLS